MVIIGASWIPRQNLAAIRLLRTLRLARISGRVKSFVFVIQTLQKSMSGIGTLMALLVGFVTIYAVLGVGLFGDRSEQFEDFFTATWTLFITLNGESWPDFAEPLIDQYWYTKLYFGTFIITVSVVVLNMIIAVFIEKTAEVWRSQREEKTKKEKGMELLPVSAGEPLSSSAGDQIPGGRYMFNLTNVQQRAFILFDWEDQNLISWQDCRSGLRQIFTFSGFQILNKPILEGDLRKVQSLLRTW